MDMAAFTLDFSRVLGNKRVSLSDAAMRKVPTTRGSTHSPMCHGDFYHLVSDQITAAGISTCQTQHGVTSGANVYIGLAEVCEYHDHYIPVLAWQNSHNQRHAMRLYVGAGVPQYDSLCLTNEIVVASRQSGDYQARLPHQIRRALDTWEQLTCLQRTAFTLFRSIPLSDSDAERAIVDLIRTSIVASSKSAQLIKRWDAPEPGQSGKTLWHLFHSALGTFLPIGHTDAISTLIDRSPLLVAYCKDLAMGELDG